MENFDELCKLYHEARIRNRKYAVKAARFVREFAAELGRQIGAPQSFRLPSNGTEIPYVGPLKINRETDSFDTLDEIPDSLPWDDEEGRWLAGIGIHLEPGGRNSYPKTEFTIQLRFTLQDQRCELQVASYLAEKKLELTADDASSWKAAIEYIITVLVRGFKLEPWEAYPAEKQKIGFTWTDRN